MPVAARLKAWVCGRSLAGIASSNPAEGMDVCHECCVLSGRGFCFVLITRPEESTECGVSECDRESLIMTNPGPVVSVAPWKKKVLYVPLICSIQLRFCE